VEEGRRVSKCARAPDTDRTERHAASTSAFPLATDTTAPNKRLRFEKRYADGGGWTTHGCAIVNKKEPSTYDPDDYTWWVYSKDLKMDVPLPPGKVPVLAEDPPYIDDDGKVF
jgi:hypothetical protein